MIKKTIFPFIALSLLCAPLSAQLYAYKDANGNTVYTDALPQGKETRVLNVDQNNPINKMESNKAPKTIRLSPEQSEASTVQSSYETFTITSPEPDAMFYNTGGKMVVYFKSKPSLLQSQGHRYRVLVDGNVVGESAKRGVITLQNLERGEHQLSVEIVDGYDVVVTQTPSQTFHIKQTTLADKRRARPCEFKDFGNRPECPLSEKPKPEDLMRKITNTVGLTKPCALADYGVREDCPVEGKPPIKDMTRPVK